MYEFLKALGVLLAFGSVLFLAYISTRLIGSKTKNAMRGKYINIVETVNLGMDKQLHLVRIDKEFVLIASSGKNIELLTVVKIDDYNYSEAVENTTVGFDFKSIFEKYIQAYRGKKEQSVSNAYSQGSAVQSQDNMFKMNLKRLKSMNASVLDTGIEYGDDTANEK